MTLSQSRVLLIPGVFWAGILTLAVGCSSQPLAASGSEAPSANDDPLQLATCTAPVGDLAHAVELPAPSWENEPTSDEHATFCALRALAAALPPEAIICAGEDSHGVAESSALVALIAKYLVFEQGVRTIVLEDMDAGLEPAQAFVRTGDPAQLAKYWENSVESLARSQELDEFLAALHDIDGKLQDGSRIELRGMDVAVQVNATLDRLTAFYQSVAPDAAQALTTAAPRDEAMTVAGCTAAAQYVAGVVTDIEAKQAVYTAATSAYSWELAHEDALNLRDGYLFLALYFQNDFTVGDEKYREPGLARNLERLAANAQGPIMVYAHNAHCAKANSIGTSRSVGTILTNTADFGSRYFVIAQAYAEGTESILNGQGSFGQRSVAGTFGSELGKVDPSAAFLLGTNSTDFAMTVPRVGDYGDTVVPANDFDALAFVRHVTPTTERN